MRSVKRKYRRDKRKGRDNLEKDSSLYRAYVDLLKEELIPAMGCTEPIAIAYAAAKARELLGAMPDRVAIGVSNNVIKNVKSVVVPNTDGMKGIEASAAAGIVGGDASLVLEVIAKVTVAQKRQMRKFLQEVPITVEPVDSDVVFVIIVTVYKGEERATVRIAHVHTNIISMEKNGEIIFQNEAVPVSCNQDREPAEKADIRARLTVKDILAFADTCDVEDVRRILERQMAYNRAISDEGLKNDYGANIGATMLKFYGNGVRARAVAKAAAGSDARMSGCELPVVINSGSGNQGIAVSVPVMEYAEELGVSREKLIRALTLSNLIAIHEKTGIGRLSAYCGAVSAGCAAGCGIAYLQGGGYDAIAHTLVNSLAIVSGIVCDGAKASCAAKIASSVEAGIFGYHMYENGQVFRSGDGIVTKGVEETIANIARLGRDGMRETDREIVRIMLDGERH